LRREREDLERIIDHVAAFNEQLRKARAGLLDGPPTLLPPVDADAAVRGWRLRRGR
jgi:hypothetical protein